MSELIQLDLKGILRKRIKGWKGRLIPGFLIGALERIIHQDDLNETLRVCYPERDSGFATRMLEHLGIRFTVTGLENIPTDGHYVLASNHPLGGLDGVAVVSALGRHFGDEHLRVPVNDMLMNIEPLTGVFLPINKYGSQARAAARGLAEAFADPDKQIVMFPAGLVSRLHDDGGIRDLQWQKMFVTKALETGRQVVPVFFDGLNTPRFYKTARLRKKSGLKINIEQALLPSELFRARGACFGLHIGRPVDVAALRASGRSIPEIVAHIRSLSDALNPHGC